MERKVLVVEDDRDIADLLKLHLQDIDCEVSLARDGPSGLDRALREKYALIILDLMLPGMEGLELCKRLRAQPHYTPILMLTAKSTELDRILGLEIGADDYITKPFSIREVLARVKALFRRAEAMGAGRVPAEREIEVDGLTIDTEKRRVVVEGAPVDLTAKEFDLLVQFARHPGRVYTRSQLLDLVWGYSNESYQHTVNSHINRLRAKIEKDPAKPCFILTVWGVGYKFAEPEEERSSGEDV
ncbi:MAG TPA: response regulator transcription factor [Vicinamibacteria bacterium]|nr:response regulator transcription factor [Vicinamibacteria bacterium]